MLDKSSLTMTESPISAIILPTLKIGHLIEFISIVVIIVVKCTSMLAYYPLFEGEQLDLTEISFQGGVFSSYMGEKLFLM